MDASTLFKSGQLRAAIDIQTIKVKGHPADQGARLFLFELLLFAGDLDRARKQLDVLKYENPQAMTAVQAYRLALDSETIRRDVLLGRTRPTFLKSVPEHAELRLQALAKYSEGDLADGDALLDQANEAAPAIKGSLNNEAVEGLRDGDDLFGTILEVFAAGRYAWVPLEEIESITMNPVGHPRDVILRPAQLALRDGPNGDMLFPGLYPGSHTHGDEAIAVGRMSDWLPDEERPTRGIGGKLYLAGDKWVRFVEWLNYSGE